MLTPPDPSAPYTQGDEPRISVALVTRNRPDSLTRTLRSLRAQGQQPFEVVVADDSDDGYVAEVRRTAEAFGCRYVTGRRLGLYANRNLAAASCRGTHVRTMDDDHEFPEGHVAACIAAVRADPDSVWIIGEFTPRDVVRPDAVPCPGQLHPRGFSETPRDPQRCWSIADGASIYPRALFDRGVRFAEHFKFGAAYLEFGSRLHWLGYRIRHLEATYVIHHYDERTRSFLDPQIDLGSRVLAMLSHSFVYRRTVTNQLLTTLEIMRHYALNGGGRRAVYRGVAAYRAHRSDVRGQWGRAHAEGAVGRAAGAHP